MGIAVTGVVDRQPITSRPLGAATTISEVLFVRHVLRHFVHASPPLLPAQKTSERASAVVENEGRLPTMQPTFLPFNLKVSNILQ